MPRDGTVRSRSPRALDLLNFFVADMQTGFGPFVAVYLTTYKWTQVQIGFTLTLGTLAALLSQIPAGALVDSIQNKRGIAGTGIAGVFIAALLFALWPAELPIMLAQVLHAVASCILTPAIAAISLNLVGHASAGERFGRNARFASVGNGLAAGVMGVCGCYLSSRSVFWLTAALCVPALVALCRVGRGVHGRYQYPHRRLSVQTIRNVLTDRRLLWFALCVGLFHLANAAMLPMAGAAATMRAGAAANLIIAACIVVPQGIVAMLSPRIGRAAVELGRRPLLLIGWAALPLRGVLLAVLPGPYLLIGGQAISGISAAIFGVMLPLIAADLSRGTPNFNLCLGIMGFAVCAGSAVSTSVAGCIADYAGVSIAFLALAAAGLGATLLLWWSMPETAGAEPRLRCAKSAIG